jgi:type I restriction enzyme M protein
MTSKNLAKSIDIATVIRDPTYVGGSVGIYSIDFNSLALAKRFDADAFDPRYDELFSRLSKSGTVKRLGDLLSAKPKRGVQPTYDPNGDILVINSQQIHSDKIDTESCSRTTKELVEAKRNRGLIQKHDVLLNSTGYITIGRCQSWLENEEAIVDSHVTILRPKPREVDPIYLSVFLNSRLGYLQTERSWTGSSGQIELRKEAIEEFQVLIPTAAQQRKIREAIEESHDARSKSKQLLKRATELVEGSIFD